MRLAARSWSASPRSSAGARSREPHVDDLRQAHGLAVVQRLQLGQLVGVGLHQIGQRLHQRRPARRQQRAPLALERFARGLHGAVHVRGPALGHVGDRRPGRGVDGGEGAPVGGVGALARRSGADAGPAANSRAAGRELLGERGCAHWCLRSGSVGEVAVDACPAGRGPRTTASPGSTGTGAVIEPAMITSPASSRSPAAASESATRRTVSARSVEAVARARSSPPTEITASTSAGAPVDSRARARTRGGRRCARAIGLHVRRTAASTSTTSIAAPSAPARAVGGHLDRDLGLHGRAGRCPRGQWEPCGAHQAWPRSGGPRRTPRCPGAPGSAGALKPIFQPTRCAPPARSPRQCSSCALVPASTRGSDSVALLTAPSRSSAPRGGRRARRPRAPPRATCGGSRAAPGRPCPPASARAPRPRGRSRWRGRCATVSALIHTTPMCTSIRSA